MMMSWGTFKSQYTISLNKALLLIIIVAQKRCEQLFHWGLTLHNVCAVHWGCAVQRGTFSTSGDIMSTSGYIMSTLGDIMSTLENIMSTLGDIMSTLGNIMSTPGRYHEYTEGIS